MTKEGSSNLQQTKASVQRLVLKMQMGEGITRPPAQRFYHQAQFNFKESLKQNSQSPSPAP